MNGYGYWVKWRLRYNIAYSNTLLLRYVCSGAMACLSNSHVCLYAKRHSARDQAPLPVMYSFPSQLVHLEASSCDQIVLQQFSKSSIPHAEAMCATIETNLREMTKISGKGSNPMQRFSNEASATNGNV